MRRLGEAGQRQLLAARALVCGCGALGSVIANTLVRSGVGYVRIVDRDFLELNNLQRQVLYDEADVAAGLPKAIAAANKLREINSQVTIEPIVTDVDSTNIAELTDGVDVIVDGTDNFETRMLLNDVALKQGIPWVYGGCLGAEGQTMTIVPGETACLRCLMNDTPPPGTTPTCDTAGILGPIVNIIASLQANEAHQDRQRQPRGDQPPAHVIDLWDNRIRQVSLDVAARAAANARPARARVSLAGRRACRATRPSSADATPCSSARRPRQRSRSTTGREAARRRPRDAEPLSGAAGRRRLHADAVSPTAARSSAAPTTLPPPAPSMRSTSAS